MNRATVMAEDSMLIMNNSTLINSPNKVPDETRLVNAHEGISLQHVANYGKTMPRLNPMTRKNACFSDRSLSSSSFTPSSQITSKA